MDSEMESRDVLEEVQQPGKAQQPEEAQQAQEEDVDMLLDFISDEDDSDSDDDDDDDESDDDITISDLEEPLNLMERQKPYKVMNEADIRINLERDISNISDILSISRSEAVILLLHFKWNVNAVPDEWFTNGYKLREVLGLPEDVVDDEAESSYKKDMTCGICLVTFSPELVASPACGHVFCHTCWADYIGKSLTDGLPSLLLRCPDTSCRSAVTQDMINMLATNDDKEKYARFLMRSYIEFNPKANWCPSPGCDYAVVLVRGNTTKVTCKCLYSFCWKCNKEAHQPIACAAVCKWVMESIVQTVNWKIATTKGCPNCGTSMDMDAPFKRMQCPSCKIHFCKDCRTSWLHNGLWEGDQYVHTCSTGKEIQVETEDAAEEQKKVAKQNLIRYQNSHMRWLTHEMHIQATANEIQKLKNGVLKILADKQGLTEAEFSFYQDAWEQIADCKRVLKWTCVYEYYLPSCEKEKRSLLNYLLRCSGFVVDQLYQCSVQLLTLFSMEETSDKFPQFRDRLCLKTSVAQYYYDNMAWALENGLSDLNAVRQAMSSRRMRLGIPTTTTTTAEEGMSLEEEAAAAEEYKTCAHCQFGNETSSLVCVMCYH